MFGLGQEGTADVDVLRDCAATADGNVVLVGQTHGDWNGTQEGLYDAVAVKLNADDGTVLWRYMVSDGTRSESGPHTGPLADAGVAMQPPNEK